MGYTAQFGNGFSATIAAEAPRKTQIVNTKQSGGRFFDSPGPISLALAPASYGGFQAPDFVANLRVDQAWGSAQIMGALHQVNSVLLYRRCGPAKGHPADKVGFVVGAGIKLSAPMIGQGDSYRAGESHPGCPALYLPDAKHELGQGPGSRRRLRRSLRCGLWRHWGNRNRSPVDHGLECQRGVRALLESAVANLVVWRLRGGLLR